MSTKPVTRVGDFVVRQQAKFFNRTGGSLKKGEYAMVDLLSTETETDSIDVGDEGSVFANVTAVTQAGYDAGYPIVMCLEDSLADNAVMPGKFLLVGVADGSCLDDDFSGSTDTDIGDAMRILVSDSAKSAQGLAADTQRSIGIALEDGAADSTVTDRYIDTNSHRRRIYFFGGLPCCQQSA